MLGGPKQDVVPNKKTMANKMTAMILIFFIVTEL